MSETITASTAEVRLLSDEQFLRRIAQLYYEDGNSMESIAEITSCSRTAVSKGLQKAREKGIVRILVEPEMSGGYLRNLSREVRLKLGLDDLVLVSGSNLNAIGPEETLETVAISISIAAAEYLDQLLTESDVLAVSGGRAFMRKVVQYLKPSKVLPHLQVMASIGLVGNRTREGDANLIAIAIAQAYGAGHLWFGAPAILDEAVQVEQLRAMRDIRESYEMLCRANVHVMSVFPQHSLGELVEERILTPEQREAIESYEPVADINHWVFDARGGCINEMLKPPPYVLSGLEIPSLKDKLKQGEANVMLVAGGGPAYVPAIRAVLRAGVANIMVTDHVTAQLLLKET